MAKPKPTKKPAANKAAAKPKAKPKAKPAPKPKQRAGFRGLRSVIYQVDDLAKARAFYAAALGIAPYFDQPFYVGFDVDGQELGLHPDVSTLKPGPGGSIAYWRVDDLAASWQHMRSIGGREVEAPHDVGGGISTAIASDPCGNLIGLIEMP